jgi:hypothetical protein
LAEDLTRSRTDRIFGLLSLGILLEEEFPAAKEPLLRLTEDRDHNLAEQALHALSKCDPEGRHRDLYLRKAKAMTHAAIEAIGVWGGPGERALLSRLHESWKASNFLEQYVADQEMRHLDLLGSNDWRDRLSGILVDTAGNESRHVPWAIAAARLRDPDSLRGWLRNRLDRSLQLAEAECREMQAISRARGVEGPPEFKSTFASEPDIPGIGDLYFDDVLVAYYRIGGKLSRQEAARLTTFGYLGDPLPRVNALMDSK